MQVVFKGGVEGRVGEGGDVWKGLLDEFVDSSQIEFFLDAWLLTHFHLGELVELHFFDLSL